MIDITPDPDLLVREPSDEGLTEHSAKSNTEVIEEERARILDAVTSARLDTMQHRVAWILSRDPDARDSDVRLMLEYWRAFHPDMYSGGMIDPRLLYILPRQISLTRARAKLQNTYRLFQATPEVQASRRSLSEEHRQRNAEQRPEAPVITVAADETGKNGTYLIVGSVWMLASEQLHDTMARYYDFRLRRGIKYEFHFRNIKPQKLSIYRDFVDAVVRPAAAVSFRAIGIERAGLHDIDATLQVMFTQLLLLGIEKETETGRAPLPRRLEFWKDQDNRSQDRVMLAAIHQRIVESAASRFEGQLYPEDTFSSITSDGSPLIQIADLFAASLNRKMNEANEVASAKSEFATYFLEAVSMPDGPTGPVPIGDMTGLIAL